MYSLKELRSVLLACLFAPAFITAQAQEILWTVGMDDNDWPQTSGGGANAAFVQENGAINPLPGDPYGFIGAQGADNDYYFVGSYFYTIPSNGDYFPFSDFVYVDEESAERAFAGNDNELRYHFNFPETLQPTDLLSVTFDIYNLNTGQPDTRYGIEVYVNNVLVQPEILVRPAQIDVDFTTPQFTLESVNAVVGPDYDNMVILRGINYNNAGGGNWMGIDYVQLNLATEVIPPPTFPWAVGMDDDDWPEGDGGGPNATFVQENTVLNDLPGVANSPETDLQADNDYYFGGSYTTVIAGNGDYPPAGIVSANEEAVERAFAGGDTEFRFHFNLPNDLRPDDRMAVTFDALSLDTSAADPRYGVEVLFNGVVVMEQTIVGTAQLNTPITTPPFTVADVNAALGPGQDNIVTLRGTSFADGGAFMGLDYVKLDPVLPPIPDPYLPWSVGLNDNLHAPGNGGAQATSFVQEDNESNPLPGDPNSPETDQEADDDYYFAGVYDNVIEGNGDYQPLGDVHANEEAAERAFAGTDNTLRYHFNLPEGLQPTDQLAVSFDLLDLDTTALDPHYGVEVYFNNVLVQPEIVVRPENLNFTYITSPFTLDEVDAEPGQGYDNIITLQGVNYSAEGGGGWMGIDHLQLSQVVPPPFPFTVGMDDNGHPNGDGGAANATFVQEAGVNPPPGVFNSPEANQQADDDYYLAGEYTTVIPGNEVMYGAYTPAGPVLLNEESAERAFVVADNDLRYHFNLPDHLQPEDQLVVSFDVLSLEGIETAPDPHYGVEVFFNGTLIMPEVVVYPFDFDRDFITPPFTLESVDARVGPGYDNIIHLRGINKGLEGGGNWMGIDYVALDPLPSPVFPIQIGQDDDGWPAGDGGGPNASFVQENAAVNELPGSSSSPELDQQADNDYYLAGVYDTISEFNGFYEPIGVVVRNEEAAERALTPGNSELRYHFNFPDSLQPTDEIAVTFDIFNLQEEGIEDPHYGIEVYFNNNLVQPEIVIRPENLDVPYTTPPFTLQSVGAQAGAGFDNIVTLRGINYDFEGGGGWMGIDHVRIHEAGEVGPAPEFTATTLDAGSITLDWTGSGALEWAPSVEGPWTPVAPAPTPPHTENLVTGENRFYRLVQ